jgi:NAD(P)-dependent dehydrogenase (short-subunit alcohol dehydrogenase family)
VVEALESRHEILAVSYKSTPITVDLGDPDSIRALYQTTGTVDAVISTAGLARFSPLAKLNDGDFALSLSNKLMGQVNLVRLGFDHMRDDGRFVLTSGVLARSPMPGSAAISLVNAGLEGFARAAAGEAPRGIRVNIVSPPWVKETLRALGMDPANGLSAATVA